jgi:hypothetical protein
MMQQTANSNQAPQCLEEIMAYFLFSLLFDIAFAKFSLL